MKRRVIIILAIVAVGLGLLAYYLYGGSTVPNGQQPLVRLTDSNFSLLKDSFNSSANSVRVIVMVSPTCPVCLRGASAFEKLLDEQPGRNVRVFVIWEPVLPSDLFAPSTFSLKRISDSRVSQYWDKPRLVSRSMGETDHNSIVWDYVAVYEPGKLWDKAPPEAAYSGGTVVEVIDETRTAIRRQLESPSRQK